MTECGHGKLHIQIFIKETAEIWSTMREQSVSSFWPELYKYDASSPKQTRRQTSEILCVCAHIMKQ